MENVKIKRIVLTTIFIITSIQFFNTQVSAMSNDYTLMYSGNSEKEIIGWAKKRYGLVKNHLVEVNEKKVLVILGDIGSGTSRLVLHLYVRIAGSEKWHLLLLRYTNTSDVKIDVDIESQSIIFKSKAGKTLITQPFDTLNLGFNREEQ